MSRIVNNASANTVFKNYSRNSAAQASSMERLATGLRINRASDDAAGLAISETLRREVKDTNVAVDNIASANNFINVTDGYLQTVHDVLGRMSELATSAGNANLNSSDKANIKTEFDKLGGEIGDIGTNAKFNDQQIFNGAARTFTVDANANTFDVTAASMASLTAPTVMTAGSDGTTELTAIKTAIETIATQRASLGSEQSQLSFKSLALQNYSENASAAESRIRDVDVAKESTMFSKSQILVQASTAMLAQANQSSQGVLSLLR